MKYLGCVAAAIIVYIMSENSKISLDFFNLVLLMLISWDLEQKER